MEKFITATIKPTTKQFQDQDKIGVVLRIDEEWNPQESQIGKDLNEQDIHALQKAIVRSKKRHLNKLNKIL